MGESAPGRMDDDGTVYVRMPDGSERSIGQWAAGDPQAGLAYFTRRYQDLIVELDLMRTRLKKGQAKPDDAVMFNHKTNENLLHALELMGGTRRQGKAPPGYMERELQIWVEALE